LPIVAAIQHADAGNRSLDFTTEKLLKEAVSFSQQHDEILGKHGKHIKVVSPSLYLRYLMGAITYNMLAGNRLKAIKYALQHLVLRMVSLKTLAVLMIGMLGPTTLASMKIRNAKRLKA
jgi:hypothetical protein